MNAFNESSNNGLTLSLKDLLSYRVLAEQLNFPLQASKNNALHGERKTRIKGRGMAFTDLRQYQKGDDIRLIDWRVTARTGKAHTRQYDEDKSQPFYLLVDYASSMYFGTKSQLKSTLATKLASTIIWQIHGHNEYFSLLTTSLDDVNFISPGASQTHLFQSLSHLVHCCNSHQLNSNQSDRKKLEKSLQLLLNNLQSGAIVILISDFLNWSEALSEYCFRLNQRSQVIIYHITDPIEITEERKNRRKLILPFTNGANVETRLLDSDQSIENDFRNRLSLKSNSLVNVSTHLSLQQQLASKLQ